MKTEYPEDLEDPEASVAWAETVSAAEQAAVLKANAQDGELDAAQKLGELGMVLWYWFIYTLWLFNIAMGNGPFIDGLPFKNGDFPWLC